MRHTRLFHPGTLAVHSAIDLDKDASHYLRQVLRLANGAPFLLFNGDGYHYHATLLQSGKTCQAQISTRSLGPPPPPLRITLYQAVSKGERMDYALQKATELGVHAICPVLSERTEVRLDEKRWARKINHWQRLVASAAEQSGRCDVPAIAPPSALAQIPDEGWLLAPSANDNLCAIAASAPRHVNLLIGAEGGLSDTEIQALCARGWRAFHLGTRILRTETAPVVALSILHAASGGFDI